nr:hypothetical protein [Tanacetum cinerariifolium]
MSDSNESGVTYTDISNPFEELSDIGSPRDDDHEHLELPEMLEDPYVEEDPVNYPTDGGDDGDDEEGSSEDEEDDDMDIEADEEEEEHLAPTDSVVIASTVADQAPSTEETEPFETDESAATPPLHPAYCMTDRISIRAPVPMPAWSDSEVIRLLAMSSPPASPLSPWSSPPPQIPFLPLPLILSPPSPVSDAPSSGTPLLLPISSSTSSPPLQLPSASRREDRPEVTLPPRKRLGIALGPRYEVGESSSAVAARLVGGLRADYGFVATMDREIMHDPERKVGYGITDSWDEIVEALQEAPVSTDTELGEYMREFETRVRQEMEEIYMRIEDSPTGTGDSPTGIDDSFAGIGYRITGTRGRSYTARVTRGGWSTADQETINTTLVTNAQLQVMIDQGVIAALAARDALRSTNGDDSHNSGTSELALLCGRMFFEESDKIEKYIEGLPDMIHGSVVASKPKTMQEAVEIATELMDKKIRTFAERETARKRNFENTSRNTQNQQ